MSSASRAPYSSWRHDICILFLQIWTLSPKQHILLASLHHSITDGVSVAVLQQELAVAYAAAARGVKPVWQPLPVQVRAGCLGLCSTVQPPIVTYLAAGPVCCSALDGKPVLLAYLQAVCSLLVYPSLGYRWQTTPPGSGSTWQAQQWTPTSSTGRKH